jgi:5-methylcytosine-specific restriction endonuclease McrA
VTLQRRKKPVAGRIGAKTGVVRWSAKSETKKLDRFCREVVFARDRDACQRCGKGRVAAALHWAHTITRAAKSVRWNLDNSQVLCYYCHFRWAHEYPLQFSEWVLERLGQERYDALVRKSNQPQPLNESITHGVWAYLSDEAQKYGVKLP